MHPEDPTADFDDSQPDPAAASEPTEAEANPLAAAPVDPALARLRASARAAREQIGRLIVGQKELIDLLLAALFAGGHVLVEGVPGIAKTLTAKLLAQTLAVDFSRIQFTPDLMPSDVIGSTIFNVKKSEFSFNPGPIFSQVVLIDEINRAPAKTQAALFEVMEEYQVTVDGVRHPMGFPFFVMATQNPIEQEGTYKLPEAQLDRFLLKIEIDYPSLSEEQQILRRFRQDFRQRQQTEVEAVLNADLIRAGRHAVEQLHIQDELLDYIAAIVHRTREHADLFLGASPRASLAILKMSKAVAALSGRDFVTPDDIQYVAYPVLNHRIILTPEREMEGFTTRDVIREIVERIEVPR